MVNTVITTDSGCNPRNTSRMIPCMVIDKDGNSYYDMKKNLCNDIPIITSDEAYNKAVNGEKLLTSSPVFEDFVTTMYPCLELGMDVVHLSTSSGISSGSTNMAYMAAEMLNKDFENKICVIDTLTAGCGGTLINDYADDLVAKGLETHEIVSELERVKRNILSTYFISKVEGFVRSGRAPLAVKLSDILSFRYRVDINENGKLYPKIPPYRGNIKNQFMKYLKDLINKENMHEFDPNYLALLITQLNEIDINDVKNYLSDLRYFDEKNIAELKFYSAIASYGVEDQIGIALLRKQK